MASDAIEEMEGGTEQSSGSYSNPTPSRRIFERNETVFVFATALLLFIPTIVYILLQSTPYTALFPSPVLLEVSG